jgi:hypothetical protein
MISLPKKENDSGQALLLVVLSLAIVLTIILSILSRSVTDIAVTSRSEEAMRAFSAAEAGVEQALVIGTDVGGAIGDSNFSAKVSGLAQGTKDFANPVGASSGESVLFWFVVHNQTTGEIECSASNPCFTGSQFKICWGESGTNPNSSTVPAIEINIFYAATPGSLASVRIARAAFDPNIARRTSNNFSAPDAGTCTLGTNNFQFQKLIDLTSLGVPAGSYSNQNGLQFAKVRLFYNTDLAHPVGIDVNQSGNGLLPSQGVKIESTGQAGESNRKIDVFQGFGEPPPIFDTAIFSSGGLTK